MEARICYAVFCSIVLSSLTFVNSTPVDNGVAGEPEIQCSSDSMSINFNAQNPFEGHVYVKGHYDETGCRTDATNTKSATIKIPFTSCGVRRQRSTNPLGLFVSTTVVITFHPMFITKVDRAYNVRCFYMSADKAVTANLDVSMLTTQLLTQNIPMPNCRYEVLEGNVNGSPVRYAIVGQPVFHKWSCQSDTVNIFCMTVHSCLVDDGQNKKVQLLDENGCAQDKYLMNNLNYTGDLLGGIESHVFKYADKPTLFFQCQIRLTLKDGNSCKRTSEACPVPTRGKRSSPTNKTKSNVAPVLNKKDGDNFDVFSDPMVILDVDDNSVVTERDLQRAQQHVDHIRTDFDDEQDSRGRFCLSPVVFGVIIAILGVVLISSLVAACFIFVRKASTRKVHP